MNILKKKNYHELDLCTNIFRVFSSFPTKVKPLKKETKNWFLRVQVKSVAECSKRSTLQFFRPSLSYQMSLRCLFCLFLSGRLRQVLLYCQYNRLK